MYEPCDRVQPMLIGRPELGRQDHRRCRWAETVFHASVSRPCEAEPGGCERVAIHHASQHPHLHHRFAAVVIDLDPRDVIRHESGDARGYLVSAGRVLFRVFRSSHQPQRRRGDDVIVVLWTNANRQLVSRGSFRGQEVANLWCLAHPDSACKPLIAELLRMLLD
eukprot:6212656-Pleurochrysis_carterae.AAC.1